MSAIEYVWLTVHDMLDEVHAEPMLLRDVAEPEDIGDQRRGELDRRHGRAFARF